MSNLLEKWYVWDKNKAISDVTKIMRFDGKVFPNGDKSIPLGQVEHDNRDYIAYTLGELVESKRGVTLRPVWKMNADNGVPSDLGGKILFDDGDIYPSDGYGDEGSDFLWGRDGGSGDIYAHQTTRTRQAKYRGNK